MVDIISNFLSTAVGFLWGTPLIVLVLGSGALFTIGTGFFQFRHFGYFCKETFGALFDKSQNEQGSGHVSAFQAAATAVGGAVGVGNIGGVLGNLASLAVAPIVQYLGVRVELSASAFLIALVFAVGTGTIFGFYPAYKASNLVPVEALGAE